MLISDWSSDVCSSDLSLQAGMLRQSILDSLPFSVIATDTEGQIVAINPAAEQLLGHPPQSLVGQSAMIMHEPAEVERRAEELSRQTGLRIPANFQVIVASGSHATADEREWTYVHRDGPRVPVNIATPPMPDDTRRRTRH